MSMDKMTVKQWRVVNELTQADMANKLGLHLNTYRNKELGKLEWKASEIAKIIALTGLSYTQLSF
jgi:DNA-binding XRE family transcriptional regulator